MLIQIQESKVLVDIVKIMCGFLGHKILKLAVSQE